MKYLLLLSITLFYFSNSFGQTGYLDGYYIDLNGEKHAVFILNKDWKNNPSEFKYKENLDDKPQVKNYSETKEFSIIGKSVYQRHVVNIDRSDAEIKYYTYSSEPVYKEEELPLRVLVSGPVNLYKYEDNKTIRYFIKTDGRIEQLIYKKYKTKSDRIATNYGFRSQLWEVLQCGDFNMDDLAKIEYKDKSLIKAFSNYLECSDANNTYIEKAKDYKKYNISIKSGVRVAFFQFSLYSTLQDANLINTTFKPYPQFNGGIEMEYVLPFNNYHWSVFSNPQYHSYKHTEKDSFDLVFQESTNISVNYSSIEIPIGFRYYIPLNKNSKLFFDAAVVVDFNFLSSRIVLEDRPTLVNDPINSNFSPSLGLGYNYKNKYTAEIRTSFNRDLLVQFLRVNADYHYIGLNVGYIIY